MFTSDRERPGQCGSPRKVVLTVRSTGEEVRRGGSGWGNGGGWMGGEVFQFFEKFLHGFWMLIFHFWMAFDGF